MEYGQSIVYANFSVFFLDFHVVGGLINDRFPHSGTLVQVTGTCVLPLAMLVYNAISGPSLHTQT